MIGVSIYDFYDFEDEINSKTSPLIQCFERRVPIGNHLTPYKAKDKTVFSFNEAIPIFYGGEFQGVLAIETDISELFKILDQNIQYQKELDLRERSSHDNLASPFDGLIGDNTEFKNCIRTAKRAAKTDLPILIIGETGTGKDVLAKAIHMVRDRKNKPFIAINCAAIPETLIESILFGTSKGIYTGATERTGILQEANGGTVFLDEINSMSLLAQSKLLRVLEDKRMTRIGSNKPIDLDIRIISATNESPDNILKNHKMRTDLYYRLAGIDLTIPPLRQRLDDIPLLAKYFANKHAENNQRTIAGISEEALNHLIAYDWPGNVRQLEAAIESAIAFTDDYKYISVGALPPNIRETNPANNPTTEYSVPHAMENAEITPPEKPAYKADEQIPSLYSQIKEDSDRKKKEEILHLLVKNNGNISKTARELGVSKQLLSYYLKKYHIS